MMRKGKGGFTIVEMLMVIGILGVLVGIITTAASTAMKQSRIKKTLATRAILQAGLETYHAQKGEWPDRLQSVADRGMGGHKNTKVVYLESSEADAVFQQIVYESVKPGASPLMDVSGLVIARSSSVQDGSVNSKARGMDFNQAILNGKHRKKITRREMAFGYNDQKNGVFRRFIVKYNYLTDSVSVLTQEEGGSDYDYAAEMQRMGEDYRNIRWPQRPMD